MSHVPPVHLFLWCSWLTTTSCFHLNVLDTLRSLQTPTTDFIQCTLLVLGGSLMLFTGLHVLGGWEQFQVSMQDLQPADSWDMFSLIQPLDHPHVPWTGVILGLTIHALSFGATSHVMIQRALAARSVHEARMGGLMAGLLKIIAVFIILVPGLIGYVMASGSNPLIEVRSPDQMFPALASYLLPTGLVGLTLAGLIAALMSSVDSEICAASGLFAMDWYKPLRPESSQRRLVWAGRIMGFALMLVGIVWAIVVIPEFRFLYEYLAKFASYLPGTTVACFLWGLVSKYPTRRAAFATLITGSLLGIFMWAATDSEVVNRLVCSDDGLGLAFLEMHFLHAAFALFATASLLLFGLSYFLPDEAGAKTLAEHDVDESLMPTKEQDQIYWVSVGALVVLFVCMYWYF